MLLFAAEELWERVDGELRAGGPGSQRLKAAARGWQPPPPPPKAIARMCSPRCGARVHALSESVSGRLTLRHTGGSGSGGGSGGGGMVRCDGC